MSTPVDIALKSAKKADFQTDSTFATQYPPAFSDKICFDY